MIDAVLRNGLKRLVNGMICAILLSYLNTVQRYPLNITSDWTQNFSDLSVIQQSWLLDSGSLTAKLKNQYLNFAVEVLSEKEIDLNSEQASVLGVTPEKALCREVILYGDSVARVYAQSWIPTRFLNEDAHLLNLGNKPLGEYIFKHAELRRHNIEVTKFGCDSELMGLLTRFGFNEQSIWSRRSVFSLHGVKLMVSETFLPGVF